MVNGWHIRGFKGVKAQVFLRDRETLVAMRSVGNDTGDTVWH